MERMEIEDLGMYLNFRVWGKTTVCGELNQNQKRKEASKMYKFSDTCNVKLTVV